MRLWSAGTPLGLREPVLGRLTRSPVSAERRAGAIAYVSRESIAEFDGDWSGYEAVLATDSFDRQIALPRIVGAPYLAYLGDEDVVQLFPDGTVQVLYRRSSEHNSILTTERCNSFCLMCSQPPREVDDSHRLGTISRLLELISPEARELGLTGGEPTLLGAGFFAIVEKAKRCLPQTALHVLTNGRRFATKAYAEQLRDIQHDDLMLGIPLYSDIDARHDYVVQANRPLK